MSSSHTLGLPGDKAIKKECDASNAPVTPNTDIGEKKPQSRPTVVGVYGVQGCGKTTVLNRLRVHLGEESYSYYDGSGMIDSVTPGGIASFATMDESSKAVYRSHAIERIGQQCLASGKVGIVAGHLLLSRSDSIDDIIDIHTQSDLDTYTHILYMDTTPEIVAFFCQEHRDRVRATVGAPALQHWQSREKDELRALCSAHGILFTVVPQAAHPSEFHVPFMHLLSAIRESSVASNLQRIHDHLDKIILPRLGRLETVLLLDADKTLAPVDAAEIFWKLHLRQDGSHWQNPLKKLFSNPAWGYSHKAFVQANWLYQEIPDDVFNPTCSLVARDVVIHPEFQSLLQYVSYQADVRPIVITAGITEVWRTVLQIAGFPNSVDLIGGGRLPLDVVVTPEVKEAVVHRLREHYGLHVCAFGDSEIDIPMLMAADDSFVVTGDANTRSKSMDAALDAAIRRHGLRARQVLLPPGSPLRLTENVLPVINWIDLFCESVVIPRKRVQGKRKQYPSGSEYKIRIREDSPESGQGHRNVHFTDSAAAKILMTSMRDAKVAGPALRAAHQRVGWFLSIWALAEIFSVESCPIDHVQGHQVEGHRLRGESRTTIVALMRGGEPMALGVSEAFPSAVFVHAKQPEDIKMGNLLGQENIILVDSVVNTGRSVLEFIEHIRQTNKTVRIVVVAGVIQAAFFNSPPGMISGDDRIHVVSLRLSENKFKGQGATDTGHRLYNTTHLD